MVRLLVEDVDPDSVAMPNSTPTTITLAEYGKAVLRTIRLATMTKDPLLPRPF